MRIVFMGTDNIALPSFRRLLVGGEVAGLVTQPDRPVGRHQVLMPPALKVLAEEAGVPVLQPESLRLEQSVEEIAAWTPDLIVVMAYGQILPETLINMPPMGCINVHASLLPRHRGASCVASAIKSGDSETGISIMHVVKKLDAGDIIKSAGFQLMGRETTGMLHQALGEFAPNVLMDAIRSLEHGTAGRISQDETLVTYAPKLGRRDGMIDWTADSREIERIVRAYDPWPGTYTVIRDRRGRPRKIKIFPYVDCVDGGEGAPGAILKVDDSGIMVKCGNGALLVHTVQPEGSRKMSVAEFAAGYNLAAGTRFENDETTT